MSSEPPESLNAAERLAPRILGGILTATIFYFVIFGREGDLWSSISEQVQGLKLGWYPYLSLLTILSVIVCIRSRPNQARNWVAFLVLTAAAFSILSTSTINNQLSQWKTQPYQPMSLGELASESPNGTIKTQWTAIITASEFLDGRTLEAPLEIADSQLWQSFFGSSLVPSQNYDPILSDQRPSLLGEVILTVELGEGEQFAIIRDSPSYRFFFTSSGFILLGSA